MAKLILNEQRCKCHKLLFKGVILNGAVEIKCLRCGLMNYTDSISILDGEEQYSLIIDKTGYMFNASDSACKILGYSKGDLVGKQFQIINPNLPDEISNKLFGSKSILNDKNHVKLDTFHQTKSGKKVPVTFFLKLHKINNIQSSQYEVVLVMF